MEVETIKMNQNSFRKLKNIHGIEYAFIVAESFECCDQVSLQLQ